MSYEIRILQLAPTPTAVVRRRARPGELSEVVPNACGLVWRVLRARSVPGAGRHIALYLDSEINLEIGVELDTAAPFVGDGEVVRSVIPGGTVATVVHVGPYHRLHEAHEAISRWCEDHQSSVISRQSSVKDGRRDRRVVVAVSGSGCRAAVRL